MIDHYSTINHNICKHSLNENQPPKSFSFLSMFPEGSNVWYLTGNKEINNKKIKKI